MEEVCEMKGFGCGRKRVEKGQNSEAKEEREKKIGWSRGQLGLVRAYDRVRRFLEGVTLCGEGGWEDFRVRVGQGRP
jgi:hypothetical protein